MRLYFKPGDLLLEQTEEGEFVLRMGGQLLETFKKSKPAVSKYNRIRADLEKKLPPSEVGEAERHRTLTAYIADSLIQHNSLRIPDKKIAKSRTFG
jgi:hypothetical protein